MATQSSSPPISPSSTSELNKPAQTEKPTSIDLWNVPALVNPSPPSNTLLITNLKSPHIFSAASLQNLYKLLNDPVPLNSFAPLPSLRRIIISYPTIEAAVATRQLLEQSSSLPTPPSPPTNNNADTTTTTTEGSNGTDPEQEERRYQQQQQQQNHEPTPATVFHRMKIYFGETTPLVGQYAAGSGAPDQHLQAPSLGKLMFISPPPSPPCGWEIRDEDPPNKTTHAEDLLAALAGIGGNNTNNNNNNYNHNNDNNDDRNDGITTSTTTTTIDYDDRKMRKEGSNSEDETATAGEANEPDRDPAVNGKKKSGHRRKGTLTVYHPHDHGDSADLPAVVVEDTTVATDTDAPEYDDDGDVDIDDETGESEGGIKALPTRTARPPVELMDVA